MQADRKAILVPRHAGQVRVKELPHGKLAGRREIDQLSVAMQEQLARFGS